MNEKFSPHVSWPLHSSTVPPPLLPLLDRLDPYEFFIEQEVVKNF